MVEYDYQVEQKEVIGSSGFVDEDLFRGHMTEPNCTSMSVGEERATLEVCHEVGRPTPTPPFP